MTLVLILMKAIVIFFSHAGDNYSVGNIDSTIVAQRPKMASHIPQMRQNIADALGISVNQVSVKATTTERLGFEGREDGISAQAVALILGEPRNI